MKMSLRSDARREREKDRISELPEHLIHHIFSFLDIVSTSILSTKWRYLWTSTPIIDLCVSGMVEVIPYMIFVDGVLFFRRGDDSPPIKKFCLYSDYSFDQSRVYRCISTVLEHKVEEIVLRDDADIILPPCLFTCESILRLSVELEDEHSIPKLLCNSAILEELDLVVLYGSVAPYLCIHSQNLKRLIINTAEHDLDVQINAPNVQLLKFRSTIGKDFVRHNFTALLDAKFFLSAETFLTSL
ncbi:F-box/FBD/LRR-repeat protein At1g51370-like [Papaver somniferum]|uniref:F-box/FBD/LRR-repeat protein At1g51370-like n=1 Tax=Papaver somniferum TaxID=3469 RepID=UPI000E6F64A4|nr:F-box/FBD/LRR-repeat protein At1g51370-like [Papaver somniferum]